MTKGGKTLQIGFLFHLFLFMILLLLNHWMTAKFKTCSELLWKWAVFALPLVIPKKQAYVKPRRTESVAFQATKHKFPRTKFYHSIITNYKQPSSHLILQLRSCWFSQTFESRQFPAKVLKLKRSPSFGHQNMSIWGMHSNGLSKW